MTAVALGKIDAYIHLSPLPFDFAAMALVVEKHGGKVTECDGSPWHAFSSSIIASNGILHDELLETIKA